MGIFKHLVETYTQDNFHDFGSNQLRAVEEGIKSVQPVEIQSAEDGKAYIELIHKLRDELAESAKLNGKNFSKMLESLLSVGEDGLYSNKLRFVFELIQNVDDCDFQNPEDCKLEMRFDYNNGEIVLEYNEKGFSPFNVFAITGIAERAKNVSGDRVEIGEKGIGFKSVFGVADSVLIQSGYFSFELRKENFTVPIPIYKGAHKLVKGTRMSLRMDAERVSKIYRELVEQYCTKEALFNKNPLLFLNKLTYLRFYFDNSWRNLEFRVSRSEIDENASLSVEDNVQLSVLLNDYKDGVDKEFKESIECIRYTSPIIYDKVICESRYGADTGIAGEHGKKMLLRVIVPKPEELKNKKQNNEWGALYSFLPTQVRLTVPMAVHAPFKLDASREFVDPQNENAWFIHTVNSLHAMLVKVYCDLAKRVQQEALRYVPSSNTSLFDKSVSGKVKCLSDRQEFMGVHFSKESIFYTDDGECHSSRDIMCYAVVEPRIAHELLGGKKHLFIPPEDINIRGYGVTFISNESACVKLFEVALKAKKRMRRALEYLTKVEKWKINEDVVKLAEGEALTWEQVEIIKEYPSIVRAFNQYAIKQIKNEQSVKWMVVVHDVMSLDEVIKQEFSVNDVSNAAGKYLKRIETKCVVVNGAPTSKTASFFIADNVLLLSSHTDKVEDNGLGAFIEFLKEIDEKDNYSINLRMKEISNMLDHLDEQSDISNLEYLKELKNHRSSIRSALGEVAYAHFLEMIRESGSNRARFLNELFQNMDDCQYDDGVVPTVIFKKVNNDLWVSHNEKGFTKKDVRGITAIGESTKSCLISDKQKMIGEKGIGFKMVFEAVDKVQIHSGEFHFSLTKKNPIIPDYHERDTPTPGTIMIFHFDEKIDTQLFEEENLIRLCLCLRKIKRIIVEDSKMVIDIEDSPNRRVFKVTKQRGDKQDVKSYEFIRSQYIFMAAEVEDSEGNVPNHRCAIHCYAPVPGTKKFPFKPALYAGLPTEVTLNISLAIDAPMKLTTSREGIQHNPRNGRVREKIYHAIAQFLTQNRKLLRTSVYDYLKFKDGGRTGYDIDIFSDPYMNDCVVSPIFKECEFLPTWNPDVFLAPNEDGLWMPKVVDLLLEKGVLSHLKKESILEIDRKKDFRYTTLSALGYRETAFATVLEQIAEAIEEHITEAGIRTTFYEYLKIMNDKGSLKAELATLRTMKIIPVYPLSGTQTQYISCDAGEIYVSKEYKKSTEEYYILKEELLSKQICEYLFSITISEMTSEFAMHKYINNFKKQFEWALRSQPKNAYKLMIKEYKSGRLQDNGAMSILHEYVNKGCLPLLNTNGALVRGKLFINQAEAYIDNELSKSMSVHKECKNLAIDLHYEDLGEMHYEDIIGEFKYELDGDDIEIIQDEYFLNSNELLEGFIEDGLISDELIAEYGLGYIEPEIDSAQYDFPSEVVHNRKRIEERIRKECRNPEWIVSVEETRAVKKIEQDGIKREIPISEDRRRLMKRYAPENSPHDGKCFCQICGVVKINDYIEVNNIEREPACHWKEGKVALCLECSRWFVEKFRRSQPAYDAFIKALMAADTDSYEAITIPIGDREIRFTQTHLAEIQAILKHQPKKNN